jgi:hypothetical protein
LRETGSWYSVHGTPFVGVIESRCQTYGKTTSELSLLSRIVRSKPVVCLKLAGIRDLIPLRSHSPQD